MPRATFALLLAIALPGAAQEPAIQEALDKRLLDPKQPTLDVQVYTGTRVPPLPVFSKAEEWKAYATKLRARVLDEVVLRGEAANWNKSSRKVEWLDTIDAGDHVLRKFRYEVIPGLWVQALLYAPAKLSGKVPAVLNVNGHERTGIATDYIQARCIHLARNGLLAMNPEWFGRGQLNTPGFNHYAINQIDLTGTSGVALHFLAQKRALDILLEHPNADPDRVAVTGLSGGGWQTIFLASLDTRVTLARPLAGYSSFVTRAQWPTLDLGDSEQTPSDLATVADYTHLTALLAPRPVEIANNANDNCCFRADYATAPLVQAADNPYRLLDARDRLLYYTNHGKGHNYDEDNRRSLYRMLNRFFFAGKVQIPLDEQAIQLRTEEQLRIELPSDSLDFRKIALRLAAPLPQPSKRSPEAARARLRQLIAAKELPVEAEEAGSTEAGPVTVRHWRLRVDHGAWTLPAVEFEPRGATSSVVIAGDDGRTKLAAQVSQLTARGVRVLAVDPFYFGESAIATRNHLFAILLAALGERPIGLQASQLGSAARWLGSRFPNHPVSLEAHGPRTSLGALLAAALWPRDIKGAAMHGGFASLREVVERDITVDKMPELFAFGLLKEFDIPQIESLAGK
jgi:dienelactone hydrolase